MSAAGRGHVAPSRSRASVTGPTPAEVGGARLRGCGSSLSAVHVPAGCSNMASAVHVPAWLLEHGLGGAPAAEAGGFSAHQSGERVAGDMLVGRERRAARLGDWVDRASREPAAPCSSRASRGSASPLLPARRVRSPSSAVAGSTGGRRRAKPNPPLQPLLDALERGCTEEPRLATILRLLQGAATSPIRPRRRWSRCSTLLATCAVRRRPSSSSTTCNGGPTTISVWEWLARSVDRSPLLLIGVARPVPSAKSYCCSAGDQRRIHHSSG